MSNFEFVIQKDFLIQEFLSFWVGRVRLVLTGAINEVLARVGTEHLRLEAGSLRFARQDMGITLDGIAPEYIVEGGILAQVNPVRQSQWPRKDRQVRPVFER